MGLDQALADDPVERNLSEQMASATDSTAAAAATAHLPPHDVKASDPDDAFPTSGLLSNENLAALNPKSAASLKNPCSLVRLALARAGALPKKQKKMRTRMGMYLHYLLSFYGASRRRSNKEQTIDGAPPSIAEQLVALFTEKGKKQSVTMSNRTKLLCRICIVSLKANGFAIPMEEVASLADMLKITLPKLKAYYREVGAKMGRGKEGTVSLKAPLTLPKVKRLSRPS
eukprot:CAMPEP_0185261420 /NCGR_PEP_ID=MMETSP1359-20130426/9815_1 /TAXON_ID=552665 /ORGANISM="Bigelowiella longifila, Strain CCMP242" /LENGTH=228 /DNA_ID=CAMNT_0027848033 /DNA_START=66 /DNA_END=752 /DNA_ORIENTATION=+